MNTGCSPSSTVASPKMTSAPMQCFNCFGVMMIAELHRSFENLQDELSLTREVIRTCCTEITMFHIVTRHLIGRVVSADDNHRHSPFVDRRIFQFSVAFWCQQNAALELEFRIDMRCIIFWIFVVHLYL